MGPLWIKPVETTTKPGDFGAVVKGQNLLVPEVIVHAIESSGVRTAADFVSFVDAFPSAMASVLNWSLPEVYRGLNKLRGQLHGHIDARIAKPSRRSKFAYGALRPTAFNHD